MLKFENMCMTSDKNLMGDGNIAIFLRNLQISYPVSTYESPIQPYTKR